jgi:branched-chain amino acid transport system ATP-binding protein
MLVAENLSKAFGGLVALDCASLEIQSGEIVGLAGPNGSGKTTMLNALSGFVHPDTGTVSFLGRRIDRMPPWKISRGGLRRTFQLPSQPMKMTVLESMLCGTALPTGASVLKSLVQPRRVTSEEAEAVHKASELLEILELARLSEAPAGSLSGGQQKLLSLGVALMGDPKLLLLDEPTAGVNPTLRRRLVEKLLQFRQNGTTILLVEHDMSFIRELCDRVFVLDKGHVITCCKPEDMQHDERIVAAYLGTSA